MSSYLFYYHDDRTHLGLAKDTPAGRPAEIRTRVKPRFNPSRDSAGCTIVMRWQRRLKSNSSDDQTLFLVTKPKHGSRLVRASLARRRIRLQCQTQGLWQAERNPFHVGHNELANHRTIWTKVMGSATTVDVCLSVFKLKVS